MRVYVRFQTFLFAGAIAAVLALFALTASTSNAAFASNLNSKLSGLFGSPDVYDKILGTAQSEGIGLSPFSLYASIGAMITPWVFALEWTVFGNLGLCGEVKKADAVKTQILTMLGAFALVVVGVFLAWNLYINMVGYSFWNAVSMMAWNADPFFGKLPSLFYTQPASFILLYGTNNLALATIWAIGGAIAIFATNFTIYVLTSRIIFAQTFDRLFPAKMAYITERTRTPVYIMGLTIIVACIWTYVDLFYSSTLSTYMASTQFMISFTIILTMIAAIVFPIRMRRHFEQSPARPYRTAIIPLALLGILVNLLIMFYLLTVPALAATTPQSESLLVGIFVAGVLYYYIVKAYRKRTGLDISQVFREIPPD